MRQQLTTHEQQCQWCQTTFVSQRSDARFCTSSCRSYAYRTDSGERSENEAEPLVAESREEVVFVFSPTGAEEGKEDWAASPQPYHEEIKSVRRVRYFTNPSRLEPPVEYVSSLHRVLYFRDEASLQLYIKKNIPVFEEGEEPWFTKEKKLYFPVDMLEE